jgi:hypothetical protein
VREEGEAKEKKDSRVSKPIHGQCLLRMRHHIVIELFFYFSYGVRLSPLGTAATVWPQIPHDLTRARNRAAAVELSD